MNWILEHFQVLVVVAVVVATLVGKVLEAVRTNKPPARRSTLEDLFGPEAAPEPAAAPPQPQGAKPPPLRHVTLPAEMGATQAELARQHEMQERLRKIREAKGKAPAAASVAAPTVVKRQTISGGLKGQLRSSKQLRRAVILREILGPPVGLR